MVQLGSSAGYDGVMEEHNSLDGKTGDEGLNAVARALVETVNSTARQLSDAVEGFARGTERVLEGLLARVDQSAGESRDMAGLAGRAADEARRFSEEMTAKVEGEGARFRADFEAMAADLRGQMDEALRSTAESVANARASAESAEQHSREVSEKLEQSLAACRAASTSAGAAAEAARQTAQDIERVIAEAHARLSAENESQSNEMAARLEEALTASRDSAEMAERAAQDAQKASLEAMARAGEAQSTPSESGSSGAGQALLDRLEADYALLTRLVQSLHDRISGLVDSPDQMAAAVVEAPEIAESIPASEAPPEEPSIEEITPRVSVGWAANSEEDTVNSAPGAEPISGPWSPISEDAERVVEEQEPQALEGGPEPPSGTPVAHSPATGGHAEDESRDDVRRQAQRPAGESWWQAEPAESSHGQMSPNGSASEKDRGTEGESDNTSTGRPAAWHWTDTEPAVLVEPGLIEEASHGVLEEEGLSAAAAETRANYEAEESTRDANVLGGRVILCVSPVPDFDRLLNLDSALSRITGIAAVTLADYARERVTFRLEMRSEKSAQELADELSVEAKERLEVSSVSAGELELGIVSAGA